MKQRRYCTPGIFGAILLFLLPCLIPGFAMSGVAGPAHPPSQAQSAAERDSDSWQRSPSSPSVNPGAGNRGDSALPTVSRYDLRFKLFLKESRLEAEASMAVRKDRRQISIIRPERDILWRKRTDSFRIKGACP